MFLNNLDGLQKHSQILIGLNNLKLFGAVIRIIFLELLFLNFLLEFISSSGSLCNIDCMKINAPAVVCILLASK